MITQDQLRNVVGAPAYDPSGDKIGEIGQVYYDHDTDQPKWVTVATGLFGTHESSVPMQGAEVAGDRVTLAYDTAPPTNSEHSTRGRGRMSLKWVNQVEGSVLGDSGLLPARAPRRLVIASSTAARGSALWVLIGAGLAVRAGRGRRAAVRGVTALVGASAASHLLSRVLAHRPRPRAGHLPARRALPEQPSSSSFPSAHATSAVAFTTALMLESPVLGMVVAPVAVVVTYSRVRTRVHWPTDVIAGAFLGAITALLTRRIPIVSRAPGNSQIAGPATGVGEPFRLWFIQAPARAHARNFVPRAPRPTPPVGVRLPA